MNCKPGDLAVIVSCSRGHERALGHICKIGEPAVHPYANLAAWEIDPPIPVLGWDCVLDRTMRPIRDNDGADETLSWAPVPATKQPVTA